MGKKPIILFLLLWGTTSAYAAELFGIGLLNATQNKLRKAVKKAGATLIKNAEKDTFFDRYSSEGLLQGSSKLYLGFVKKDRKFAFAEYEFDGLLQPRMLQKLTAKYGKGRASKGKFLSDKTYTWQSAGITIELSPDWQSYQTRLTYYNPAALQRLREEQQQYKGKLNQQHY